MTWLIFPVSFVTSLLYICSNKLLESSQSVNNYAKTNSDMSIASYIKFLLYHDSDNTRVLASVLMQVHVHEPWYN